MKPDIVKVGKLNNCISECDVDAARIQAKTMELSMTIAILAALAIGQFFDPTIPPTNPDPETMFPHLETMFPHFMDKRFWLSGQVNFIFQTHPGFHADYF